MKCNLRRQSDVIIVDISQNCLKKKKRGRGSTSKYIEKNVV